MLDFTSLPWNKKIQVLRVAKGLSQTAISKECGTNQKVYWLWEKGLTYPILNNRKAIASALGVQMSDIFNPEIEKKERSISNG